MESPQHIPARIDKFLWGKSESDAMGTQETFSHAVTHSGCHSLDSLVKICKGDTEGAKSEFYRDQKQPQRIKQRISELKMLSSADLDNNPELIFESRELQNIQGIIVDREQVHFLTTSDETTESVNIKDILLPVLVYYDSDVKRKDISFSLEPADPKNPYGEFQRKTFFPDEHEGGKMMMARTIFGEELFEADYLMKEMSIGTDSKTNKPFEYPEKIKHLFSPENYGQKERNEGWNRKWFVVDNVSVLDIKEDSLKVRGILLEDIKVKVLAKQMHISEDGTLKDSELQDPTHRSYEFAKKFTDHYDEIAEYYPIFKRLKKLYKAVALAEWLYANNIPIDLNLVRTLVDKQRIPENEFTDLAPSLSNLIEREKFNWKLFGGVNMNIGFRKLMREAEEIQVENPEKQQVIKIIEAKSYPENIDLFIFPLQRRARCQKEGCGVKMTLEENYISHFTQQGEYCAKHHPNKCTYCEKIIYCSAYKQQEGFQYHVECFKCYQCKQVVEKYIGVDEKLFHRACLLNIPPNILNYTCSVNDCGAPLNTEETYVSIISNEGRLCSNHHPMQCTACRKIISSGNYKKIDDKKYHSDCVICWHCKNPVTKYLMAEEKFFHRDCMQSMPPSTLNYKCSCCDANLDEEETYVAITSSFGKLCKNHHPWVCSGCGHIISGEGAYYTIGSEKYHDHCYTCEHCKEHASSSPFHTVGKKIFHDVCLKAMPSTILNLKCTFEGCGSTLNSEETYAAVKGKDGHLCSHHHPSKCYGCKGILSETHSIIGDKKYHKECVKCYYCKEHVNKFFSLEEKLFHESCIKSMPATILNLICAHVGCKAKLNTEETARAILGNHGKLCAKHHPMQCAACERIIYQCSYNTVGNKKFHSDCLRCWHCKEIVDKIILLENKFFHEACLKIVDPETFGYTCSKEGCDAKLNKEETYVANRGQLGKLCSQHHPMRCFGCKSIIFNCAYFTIGERKFHSDCLKCAACDKKIEGKYSSKGDMFYHIDCPKTPSTDKMSTEDTESDKSLWDSWSSFGSQTKKVTKM